MPRSAKAHEEESLRIARELVQTNDYNEQEIALVVDDALRFHSCHANQCPDSMEGKVLATADSMAHLKTDFYLYFIWVKAQEKSFKELKGWLAKKIERDYHNKILFEEVKDELSGDYTFLKELFSR